jgi:hypothetical protein
MRPAQRTAGGIRLTFQINAWFAMSGSSWAVHLMGHKRLTSLCRVRSVESIGDLLTVSASCLAIGSLPDFGGAIPTPALQRADAAEDDFDAEWDGVPSDLEADAS